MAKLTRKSAKVFAEQASAGIGGVSQFGSLAAGDPQYSKDVDVIQALDAYKNGWSDAVVGNKSPAIEDRNALDYLLSYQQAYIMQRGVPEWLSTETYYKNCYAVDSNGQLRYSLIDNNIGNNPIDDSLGQLYWGFGGARGTGKSVGEVYFSQSSSAVDNPGALPLWTGELIANANSLYPQFYDWVQSHTSLCVTQAQYDSRISQYGECPFYVITSTTIRLPKLVNYLKMASGSTLGQSEAGLPDVLSISNAAKNGAWSPLPPYATSKTNSNGYDLLAGATTGIYTSYDYVENKASLGSDVYGNSSTVTPSHTTLFPWVYAYNQAVAASTAQAAEFQQALSGKADKDLANITVPVLSGSFTPLNVKIAEGNAGIAGTYTLADLPNDGKVRLVLFEAILGTNGNGHSSMAIQTDVMSSASEMCSTNNGYSASATVLVPCKKEVTLSFPDIGAGVVLPTRLVLKGYIS